MLYLDIIHDVQAHISIIAWIGIQYHRSTAWPAAATLIILYDVQAQMSIIAYISSSTPSVLLGLLQHLFKVGDRVRCVVVNIDKSGRRLSLSTAVLEENKGDMLVNKVAFPPDRTTTAIGAHAS